MKRCAVGTPEPPAGNTLRGVGAEGGYAAVLARADLSYPVSLPLISVWGRRPPEYSADDRGQAGSNNDG